MGQSMAALIAAEPTWHLVASVGRGQRLPDDVRADVLIDFSQPEALPGAIDAAARLGIPLISGTTGLGADHFEQLRDLSRRVPVLWAANFSFGVAVLTELALYAERWLGREFDLHLHESHHRHKRDAPSGTALAIGRRLAAAGGREPEYSSLRGGSIVGVHSLQWSGPGETLTLSHRAEDRSLFARGALRAAAALIGRPPGWYELRQLLFEA
jgi:4-hydroxy-tetrahydrodipicolinate reductase